MSANDNPVKLAIIEFAKANGGKGLKFEILGAMQYYKWLSYIPEFMQKYIDEISSKSLSELSPKQLNDYEHFLQEKKMVNELKQFFSECWALADTDFIQDFIDNHPLSKIKRTRLTDEEYDSIIEEIQKSFGNYRACDIDKISDSFSSLNLDVNGDPRQREYYDSLSMREAYIYDFRSNLFFNRSMAASKEQALEEGRARAKSLTASKNFTNS